MKNNFILSAGNRLYKKLLKLDLNSLAISDYTKNYLKGLIAKESKLHLKRFIKNYFFERLFTMYPRQYITILKKLFDFRNLQDLQNITFLEHGGGTGFLSLLAAEVGIKHVYYNDIYDTSCIDFGVVAEALGHKNIKIIQGDIEDIQEYCKLNNILFDRMGSFDVIEHIYNIKEFLLNFPDILSQEGSVFFYSGANSYNPDIVKKLTKMHERIEFENREYKPGWKKRDSLQSYASIREKIIKEIYISKNLTVPENEVLKLLITVSRGLIKADIESVVYDYINNKTLPITDTIFPSNTCDPLTGNWAEHLMDFQGLLNVLEQTFNYCYIYPEKKINKASCIGLYAKQKKASIS